MKNRFCLILIFLAASCCRTYAGADALEEVISIMNRLKSLRTYSYVTETHAVFPTGETGDRHMVLYMDIPNKRLVYKHDTQVFLLTPEWVFQANISQKTVSVFDVARYNERYKGVLPELESVFASQVGKLYIDSLLLGQGKLRSSSRKGDLGTFVLGFPPESFLKEMVLVYNYRKKLPERIRMKSYTPPRGNQRQGTTIEILSTSYTENVPESVFDPGQYFRIAGGKVVLQQYKNYKVSSIL